VVESTLRALPTAGRARLLVASRDLSARTAVDEQLDSLAQNWTEVFDAVREGVLVVDTACTVLCANHAAGILLGVHPQVLPGSPLARYVEPVEGQPDFDATTQFLRGGAVPAGSDVLCVARRSDAPMPSLRMTATPLPRRSQRSVRRNVVLLDSAAATVRNANSRGSALRALLSPREVEVLRLLADGHDVHDVSSLLGISIHTTRNYVKSVLHKLDVRNQLQAVVVALRAGLFELS
jgi:DNA-binding CsgD family transcriptional regulator